MVRARTRVGATVGATVMCVGGGSGGGGGVRSARRLHLGELPGEVVGEGEVSEVSAHQLHARRALALEGFHRALQLLGAVLCPMRGSGMRAVGRGEQAWLGPSARLGFESSKAWGAGLAGALCSPRVRARCGVLASVRPSSSAKVLPSMAWLGLGLGLGLG